MDTDDLDNVILYEEAELCVCSNPRAHKRECPMNRRYSGRCNFKPGDAALPLVSRVAQLNVNRYTLLCKRGTLSQRFAASEHQHTDTAIASEISLDGWCQSDVISTRELSDDDLSDCCCKIETPHYHYIEDDNEGTEDTKTLTAIETPLYTLSSLDASFGEHRYEWLNDKVITASQQILAQQFPHIGGLQPPTLQEVRRFRVHRGEFVQNNYQCE